MHIQMVMTQVITTCEVFINYNLSKEGINISDLFVFLALFSCVTLRTLEDWCPN